jgi:hypothetical protein
MALSKGSRKAGRGPKETFTLHLVLRDGFQRHRVVITMNDRKIYQAADVTTDAAAARADARDVIARSRTAHLVVSVTPGNLAAAFDVDIVERPYVAISLIGEATVAFETSAAPFR